MSRARRRPTHKHFRLDEAKIQRAQKVLGTGTQTETIERALDLVIAEEERNRIALASLERFLKSRVTIRDAYGKLDT